MIRYASIIIKRARKEAGMSRMKLIEEIGDYKISYKTVTRIERGKEAVRKDSVAPLLDYFGIKLPYELQDETEKHIMIEGLKNEDLSIKECIEEINGEIAKHRALFRGESHPLFDCKIKSLMEWLVYFPLFPLDCVYDVLSRICGSCYRREEYVLDQMNYLYRSIPESDMKKVADRLAECVRGCGEGKIPSDDDIKTYKELVQKKMDIEDRLYRIRSLIEKSCQIAEE